MALLGLARSYPLDPKLVCICLGCFAAVVFVGAYAILMWGRPK